MATDTDPETPVSVSMGEVRVEKTFEADRFPVPAIAFEIESLADEPIRVRLVDDIPDSFAMEGVGFHPDYEGDNWAAYGNHQVGYERTLDPGESVLTVYGIRIDDQEDAAAFLEEPTIELIDEDGGEEADDVLGRETTQPVRDALSGEEGPLLGESDADGSPDPRATAEGLASVLGARDREVTAVDVSAEREAHEEGGPDAETPTEAEATAPDAGATVGDESVAAALAAEIREGRVDDDDLDALRDAFEGSVPTSVDVRVGRLQSQVEDLLAYREALAGFLDENGTAQDVSESVADLSDRVSDVERSLDAAESERATLDAEVASAAEAVEDVSGRLDAVAADLAALEATAERLDERVTAVEELEGDVEEIHAELDELRSFRDRLSDAFGTGED